MLSADYENSLLSSGRYSRVVGMDEVGRGCLAGPVTVGAFVFYGGSRTLDNINDSKQLSPGLRIKVSQSLIADNSHYLIEYASAKVIDDLGITVAIAGLMAKIVQQLDDGKTLFLIDGQFSQNFGNNTNKVVHGDEKYYSIAAASILAKVDRDQQMVDLVEQYPGFSFDKHKGYGTKQHLQELFSLGVTNLHRKSFAPVGSIQKIYI